MKAQEQMSHLPCPGSAGVPPVPMGISPGSAGVPPVPMGISPGSAGVPPVPVVAASMRLLERRVVGRAIRVDRQRPREAAAHWVDGEIATGAVVMVGVVATTGDVAMP